MKRDTPPSDGGVVIREIEKSSVLPRPWNAAQVTGTGDTISGTSTSSCCSAIRAEIANPDNSSNIIVNRSGDLTSFTTQSLPATSGIHVMTVGAGNIIVASGVGSTITSPDQLGINAQASGQASSGSINVSTGTFGTIDAGGTGRCRQFAVMPVRRSSPAGR
jgi:hypothetical protein